ncbi:MAG: HDOD domain-containing protein [Rhodocyclaceae bacterium]|jgi:EAL and modified HD-GYP domain-containing signal transduction protein|nr:HDOD domain-containing protein [Rhodocyclaceae bacterium]
MSPPVFLTREPVVNKNRAITANRIVAHGPNVGAVVETLAELAESWPDRHTVFLSLGKLVPTPDLLAWQIPPNTQIEIPAPTLAHPQTQALLPKLREAGIPVCLTWHTPTTALPAGVDWRFVIMDVRKFPRPENSPTLTLSWGLADVAAFQTAVNNGYDGASGWFFLRGSAAPGQLAPAHGQIVRLLNLVRQNAEIKEIEAVLKQDVALSYKLLRYINSAGFGLMCEIQSFRHAVSILGYANLNKWLSLLLVTASRDPSAPAMMQTAIARGRFMEEIGAGFFDRAAQDNLFITGAFSLLHALLGTSMETLLEEMHLPNPISEALLGGQGEFTPFLELARKAESFDAAGLIQQAQDLHLDAMQVNRALLTGVKFADTLQT